MEKLSTNDDGKFTIKFPAIPDESISKEYKAVFDYTIYADVTDINGETHSAVSYVSVGYTALLVDCDYTGNG